MTLSTIGPVVGILGLVAFVTTSVAVVVDAVALMATVMTLRLRWRPTRRTRPTS